MLGHRVSRPNVAGQGALPRHLVTNPCINLSKASPTAKLLPSTRAGRRSSRSTVSATAAPITGPSTQQAPPEVKHPVTRDVISITKNLTLLRATCMERLPEIEFGQRLGTTINSYIINGAGGAPEVIVDVPSKAYNHDITGWLKELGALKSIKKVVVTRLNPERVESLKKLLIACGDGAQLLATNPALQLLKERSESDEALAELMSKVDAVPVTRGTEISLSNGNKLSFIPIPTPRWPELTAVYLQDDNALLSSNFFGAHKAPANSSAELAFDKGGWGVNGDAWKYYYECMLAPVAKQTSKALDRLAINAVAAQQDFGLLEAIVSPLRSVAKFVNEITLGADDGAAEPLAVSLICPIHGPVVKTSLTELVRRYIEWTAAQVKAASAASVAVLYASAYGNTASLAQAISRGITKAGVGVETLNLEMVGVEEVDAALQRCDGFIIGSPTLGGHMPTQVQTALGAILRSSEAKRLPCGVFGSFGWSGEAVDMMEGRLKDAGFQLSFDSIRCKFKPTEKTLQQCEESGTDLAQAIKKIQKRKERVAAEKLSIAEAAPPPALAMGRVVGSLCVLTAKDGDAQSAMLASWVSQASFDPPGLTVAVKKDRAVENLLPIGNRFVLNVLGEGKDRPIIKQLLKPFKPAEDRFAGMNVEISETSGAVIIPESAAYLECTVGQRMEAGDHWIVYASVESGKVLDENVDSAVHFRKVGTTY